MNKYILKAVCLMMLAAPVVTSCDLDIAPEDMIVAEESWETVKDAERFHYGMLSSLRGSTTPGYNYVPELQADLFNARQGTTSCNLLHDWSFTTTQFDGDFFWSGGFGLITTANNILDNIDKVKVYSESEQMQINTYKGEAHFARAFAYARMVQRYCVNYENDAQAQGALGLPLLTKVDVNAKPARATLAQTYAFINSDLAEAERLLKGNDEITGDFTRPNVDIVTALKARVCLNQKRYGEAITLATSLFDKYPLTPKAEYKAMWAEDYGTEIIWQPVYTQIERSAGYTGIFIGYNVAYQASDPQYIPTQGLIDLYTDTKDVRKNTFFRRMELVAQGKKAKGYAFMKYPGNESLLNDDESSMDTWVNMPKVFRTSEMYLIAAEASLYKENPSTTDCLGYLNDLRNARGITTPLAAASFEEVEKEMKDEWVREMVGEGFRLDCLKRWKEGIMRKTAQSFPVEILNTNYFVNVPTNDSRYYKIIWEIPTNDLQANGNLIPNWGGR